MVEEQENSAWTKAKYGMDKNSESDFLSLFQNDSLSFFFFFFFFFSVSLY